MILTIPKSQLVRCRLSHILLLLGMTNSIITITPLGSSYHQLILHSLQDLILWIQTTKCKDYCYPIDLQHRLVSLRRSDQSTSASAFFLMNTCITQRLDPCRIKVIDNWRRVKPKELTLFVLISTVCSSLAKKSGFLEDLESAQKKDPNRHNINGDLEVSPMSNFYRPADVSTTIDTAANMLKGIQTTVIMCELSFRKTMRLQCCDDAWRRYQRS